MLTKTQTSYQDNPTCPYCGHKESDPWELDMRDGEEMEIDCGSCELPFLVSCNISICYSSKMVTAEQIKKICAENEIPIPEGVQ